MIIRMKKTVVVFGSLAMMALMLGGCSSSSSGDSSSTTSTSTTQKSGTTTKTGKIVKLGKKYGIQEAGKQPAEIDTYSLDLSQYEGKTVTVSGQYSGDTLFVTKVE